MNNEGSPKGFLLHTLLMKILWNNGNNGLLISKLEKIHVLLRFWSN